MHLSSAQRCPRMHISALELLMLTLCTVTKQHWERVWEKWHLLFHWHLQPFRTWESQGIFSYCCRQALKINYHVLKSLLLNSALQESKMIHKNSIFITKIHWKWLMHWANLILKGREKPLEEAHETGVGEGRERHREESPSQEPLATSDGIHSLSWSDSRTFSITCFWSRVNEVLHSKRLQAGTLP